MATLRAADLLVYLARTRTARVISIAAPRGWAIINDIFWARLCSRASHLYRAANIKTEKLSVEMACSVWRQQAK